MVAEAAGAGTGDGGISFEGAHFQFWKPAMRNATLRERGELQFIRVSFGAMRPVFRDAAAAPSLRLSKAKRMVLKETNVHSPAASVKPEEQELARKREEQAALEIELADRELRSANLRAELGAFERQYLHFVGSRYADLDELKAQIAERLAKEQPGNERAQQAALAARARASETKSVAGDKTAEEPKAFRAAPGTKRLYRDVAKRIHPDLTSDREDRVKRQQLMAEANEAYERGDEARLTSILTEYECSPEAVQGEGAGAELVRAIRRISQARGRLAEIEAEMQEALRSDLYQLKSRLDDAQKHGRDVLKEMVEKVDDQIAQAKRRLENHETVPRP
jgi:hypothetical protein